jgi:tetratricopeptide (TPR) repeat protein
MANSDIDLGFTLTMLGKYAEAEAFDRDAIRIYRSMFDDKNAMVVMARDHLGDALRGQGRFKQAETLLLAGYERFKLPNSVTKLWRGHALTALVRLYEAQGRPDEAAKYRAILSAPPPALPALVAPAGGPASTHRPP